jgi:hypothetical protein
MSWLDLIDHPIQRQWKKASQCEWGIQSLNHANHRNGSEFGILIPGLVKNFSGKQFYDKRLFEDCFDKPLVPLDTTGVNAPLNGDVSHLIVQGVPYPLFLSSVNTGMHDVSRLGWSVSLSLSLSLLLSLSLSLLLFLSLPLSLVFPLALAFVLVLALVSFGLGLGLGWAWAWTWAWASAVTVTVAVAFGSVSIFVLALFSLSLSLSYSLILSLNHINLNLNLNLTLVFVLCLSLSVVSFSCLYLFRGAKRKTASTFTTHLATLLQWEDTT